MNIRTIWPLEEVIDYLELDHSSIDVSWAGRLNDFVNNDQLVLIV